MSAMTNHLENELAELVFAGVAYPTTSGVFYTALFSGATSDALTSGGQAELEVSGGNYARVLTSGWAIVSGAGTVTNQNAIRFPKADSQYTVSGFALMSQPASGEAAGTAFVHGALTTPRTVMSGEALEFEAGDLVLTWD